MVTTVALPAYMIDSISSKYSAGMLLRLSPDLFFPVLSMMILFALTFLVCYLLKVPKTRKGTFKSMFLHTHTVFIGLPVNLALFGPRSLPYVLVYYMAHTKFFWNIGVYLNSGDGPQPARFDLKKALGQVFTPPLRCYLFGIVLVLLNIQLPEFSMADLTYVGDLTVPGSMFFIGIALHTAGWRQLRH